MQLLDPRVGIRILAMHYLIERLERFGSPRILLIGDFMLDRYVHGDAERISPEAPVPVLRMLRTESRVGGAGNVAAAILALGAKVACVGVVGQDAAGEELSRLLVTAGAEVSTLVRLSDVGTTVKTRFVGLAQHRHAQQMLRVDEDPTKPVGDHVGVTLRAAARGQLRNCAAVAIEDYDKGVLTNAVTPQIIADARAAGKTVIVDPARIGDYRRYRGATVIKPNRDEAHLATGVSIHDEESLKVAAQQIVFATEAQAVVITLDREGAYLYARDGEGRRIPTRPRAVYDVTGAGDETLAMMAVALAEGCTLDEAVALANVAGGLEVERFCVVPIRREEVHYELRHAIGLRDSKVMERKRLADEVARRRRSGEVIAFTNGCFDLLHVGHVRYLQQAREQGSCLIVAINSDDSVRRLKGPSRPVIGQNERAEMLASLECVDFVTVFEEDTPIPLLELLRPDVLVKGGTTPVVVGRELVEGYGGKVITTGAVEGLSTTEIINRIVNTKGGG